jgi:hypothetical protein
MLEVNVKDKIKEWIKKEGVRLHTLVLKDVNKMEDKINIYS